MESEPARDALAAFRDATRCSPELRDDNLRAIEARLHGVTPLRRPSPILRTTVVIVAVLAAAAIAVWIAGTAPSEAIARRDDVREQAVDAAPGGEAEHRAAQRVARPPVAVPEPPTPSVIGASAAEPHTRVPPPRVAEREPAPEPEPIAAAPVAADGLARESALLAELKRAVDARQLATAAQTIATLEREFPDGVLVEERWALQVMMHCNAHAPVDAASTAAAFRRARPRSSLAQRLSEAPCPTAKSR